MWWNISTYSAEGDCTKIIQLISQHSSPAPESHKSPVYYYSETCDLVSFLIQPEAWSNRCYKSQNPLQLFLQYSLEALVAMHQELLTKLLLELGFHKWEKLLQHVICWGTNINGPMNFPHAGLNSKYQEKVSAEFQARTACAFGACKAPWAEIQISVGFINITLDDKSMGNNICRSYGL